MSPSRRALFFMGTQNRALCFSLVAAQGLLQPLLPQWMVGTSAWLSSPGAKPLILLTGVPTCHKMPQGEIPGDTSTAANQTVTAPGKGSPVCWNPCITQAQDASFLIPTLDTNSARESKGSKKSNAGAVNTKSTWAQQKQIPPRDGFSGHSSFPKCIPAALHRN